MNLFVTISFTLLVILAALFYLLKVRNENHGPFYRWAGILVLMAAAGLFLFLVFKGVKRLIRHDYRDHREMQYRHDGKKKRMKMRTSGNASGCSHDASCCMEMKHGSGDSTGTYFESSTDTIDGKIIRKEIEIINK